MGSYGTYLAHDDGELVVDEGLSDGVWEKVAKDEISFRCLEVLAGVQDEHVI